MSKTVGLNISNRLDRLPFSSIHKSVLFALSIAYFFEFANLNTFSYTSPVLIKLWHLPLTLIAAINSSAFFGMFLGASMGGRLGDKLGRKRSVIISIVVLSVFSAMNAISWNALSFAVFWFFTGAAVSSLLVNANTYIVEFFPKAMRGKYQGLAVAIGITGIPITGWVSRYFIPLGDWGWRLVFLWSSLGILSLFLIVKLFELPRWYEINGQTEKAKEIIQRIETIVINEIGSLPEPEPEKLHQEANKGKIIDIFKGYYLKRTLVLTSVWVFQTIAFYGFGSWVPTLLVKQGIDLKHSLVYATLITLGAPLGAILGSVVSDRFERKTNIILSCFFIAASVVLFGVTLNPVLIVVFGFLINLIERIFSTNLYTYTSELYGTEVRSFGQGMSYGIGRFSNVLGPFSISFIYAGYGYLSVFIFIAVCWIASGGVVCFGPRTSKRSLEEINGLYHNNRNVESEYLKISS